jgi:microcystin-dependent protein
MNFYLGQIELFAFGFAPEGWEPCQGQLLPISQNQALFSLLGTTYGGNGETDFALPNMEPAGPEGPRYFIRTDAANSTYPPRQ